LDSLQLDENGSEETEGPGEEDDTQEAKGALLPHLIHCWEVSEAIGQAVLRVEN
jgi:hypothetical protein